MGQTDATLPRSASAVQRRARTPDARWLRPYLYLLPVFACLAFFAYNASRAVYESTQYHVLAYP